MVVRSRPLKMIKGKEKHILTSKSDPKALKASTALKGSIVGTTWWLSDWTAELGAAETGCWMGVVLLALCCEWLGSTFI